MKELTFGNLGALVIGVGLTAFWIAESMAHEEAVFPMPTGKAYVAECGACHTAYAPGLLPERAWRRMMSELDNHFGEDASLDDAERDRLAAQVFSLAADSSQAGMLMKRIAMAIPVSQTPQRISTTPFFKYMHDEVPGYIWKRAKVGGPANCIACHGRANEGNYDEREVRIPKS